MTSYYFIRHGESVMNTTAHLVGGRSNGTKLSQRGESQARQLGEKYLELSLIFDDIYSSPATRTHETAKHILAAAKQPMQIKFSDELYELSQGSSEGLSRDTVYTPEVLEAISHRGKDFKLPGGESMNDVGERMQHWLAQTDTTHTDDESILVVTHGIAIKCVVARLQDLSQDWIYRTPIPNVSVTKIESNDGNFTVRYIAKEMV